MKTCTTCGIQIPSSNTTGICVVCTHAARPLREILAAWDVVIDEQERLLERAGVTADALRGAAEAIDTIDADELEGEDATAKR